MPVYEKGIVAMTKKFNRLLVTGASGGLATALRNKLGSLAHYVRLSDVETIEPIFSHEEIIQCDLADRSGVNSIVKGCDAIIHFGGRSKEDRWEIIRDSNIEAMYNLYEASRTNGKPRILFASSNHVTGFYPQSETINARSPTRPDSLYGVSKVFGEAMARMYFDKFGQETAIVRIGYSFPEPIDHRTLATWLSYNDLFSLIKCVFEIPTLGCPIIYGLSKNDQDWWDNTESEYIGWKPNDSSEVFRSKIEKILSNESCFQGGDFTKQDLHTKFQ